jgi:hypothetical protein
MLICASGQQSAHVISFYLDNVRLAQNIGGSKQSLFNCFVPEGQHIGGT